MRAPTIEDDGWQLLNAEELHLEFPGSFEVPDERIRTALAAGDFAKLLFSIGTTGEEGDQEVVERMWVVVSERVEGRYLGLLDNEPEGIAENDRLWLGVELPFGPEHIIDAQRGDAESLALSKGEPLRRWPR